jgi:hypothetical protein
VKTEHVNTLTRLLRELRPVDVLLPIGAALVAAGLQNLAERESRQRQRLDQLATLAADHVEALTAAGLAVPASLADDELHPLDPELLWMPLAGVPAGPEPVEQAEPGEKRGRGWKLAAAGLAAATGITLWKNRGRIFDRLGDILEDFAAEPDGVNPDLTPDVLAEQTPEQVAENLAAYEAHRARYEAMDECVGAPECGHTTDPNGPNAGRETPAAPWVTCLPDNLGNCANKIHDHRAVSAEPVDEPDAVSVTPREECGWPNCEWTSDPKKSETGQATQAAVHRNRCIYRPAGAGVTP